jgi:hypothetical protein
MPTVGHSCGRILLLLAMYSPLVSASELKVTSKPAPDRGGLTGFACPPNFSVFDGDKQPFNTDIRGKHQDYGDDEKRMLYYEGETDLVLTAADGSKTDLKVVQWCLAQKALDQGKKTAYQFLPEDYFTYEIFTSKGDKESSQVPPGELT